MALSLHSARKPSINEDGGLLFCIRKRCSKFRQLSDAPSILAMNFSVLLVERVVLS